MAAVACSLLWSCESEIDKFPPEPKNSSIVLADEADANICVDENEGVRTIAFTTKGGWTASMVNDRADEWFTISPTSGAIGENTISIEFAENTEVDERNASFLIKSGVARKTITVTQKPANSISMTSNRIEVPATGGLQAIVVRSKNACTATVADKDKSWITIEPASKAVETEIRFTVTENTAFTVREGTIILSNGEVTEEFTVYQEGVEQEIVLTKSAYALPAAGGEVKVEVTSNVPVVVKMPEEQWITESATKSSSTNTYVFNVSANTTPDERTATVTFTSEYGGITKTVTIRQSGMKTEESLISNFKTIRTGKASPALVENITIEYYGTPTRLKELAGITAPEPRLLVIQPWDKSSLGAVEKAILASNIGITPMNDGTHIKLPIPELSQDRRLALAKQAKGFVEEAKVALRNIRRDGNEVAKKAQKDGVMTEDELKKMLDDIQKLTDRYIASLEKELANKEKELMTV